MVDEKGEYYVHPHTGIRVDRPEKGWPQQKVEFRALYSDEEVARKGYAALSHPWELRLTALYQAAQPAQDLYRYWFGEVDRNANDTMRQIARQSASLKLHDALIARIQGGEWTSEMRDLLAWHQQSASACGASNPQGEDIVSPMHQCVAVADSSAARS